MVPAARDVAWPPMCVTSADGTVRALAYPAVVGQALVPEMDAGRRLLTAFSRHPGAFHAGLSSPKGWHAFARFCRSELPFAALVERRPVSVALSLMSRF